MLFKSPELFVTSYEESRNFKGEDLHIDLKGVLKLVQQGSRRMGQEQMGALKEEVDKLLSGGFTFPWGLQSK